MLYRLLHMLIKVWISFAICVRNHTPILEIRAEAEFRAVRTDHSAAPLHSFIARPFFYSVVAFLVFCLYSPLRCPEHLRQYRRLSIVKSYSPPTAPFYC